MLAIFARRPKITTSEFQLSIPCDRLLSTLDNVVDNPNIYERCYTYDGYLNNQVVYDRNQNWTIGAITSKDAPAAIQICQQVCQQPLLANTCLTVDNTYNACLNNIKPVNCTDPSVPVARDNSTYYYVLGFNRVNCYPNPIL